MKTIIDFTNKVKSLVDGRISNIANVEESPSTHSYTIGKQLIFNGLLCKATSAISVGDTLAVGTNLALSDNVVEQIYSLNQGLTNSLDEIADMNNVLGAKNLLPNNATNQTVNGVTFTVNDDGSITVNGTATALTDLSVYSGINPFPKELDGKYVTLSYGHEYSTTKAALFISLTKNGSYVTDLANTYNKSSSENRLVDFSIFDSIVCGLRCYSGQTFTNYIIYPMLRLASIQDDTYVPYSMTNRELSDNISNGYILIGTHRVRVTSNSTTTTYAGLINNLYSDSAAYINSLNSDAYYQLATARVPGSDIKYITNDIATNNSLSQLEQNLFMMIKIGATLFMYDIEVRNNASRVFKYNSDGTLTDVTNNVIGQERAIDFNFNLYRYNNN